MKLLEILKKDRFYMQRGAGLPLYVTCTAESAFMMKDTLGYGFDYFIQSYKNGYADAYYSETQNEKIWKMTEDNLRSDSEFLEKTRHSYDIKMKEAMMFYAEMDKAEFSSLEEEDMLAMMKRCVWAQACTMGVGHMIEAVSLGLDKALKDRLGDKLTDRKLFNRAFAELTKPTKPSFVSEEQNELEKLDLEDDAAIDAHVRKYFYLLNSYAGPRAFTKKECLEMAKLPNADRSKMAEAEDSWERLLDDEIRGLLKHIDMITDWQDDRKRNILIGFTYLGRMMDEVSKMIGLERPLLDYVTSRDLMGAESIGSLKGMLVSLEERQSGMFFMHTPTEHEILTGELYLEAIKMYSETEDKGTEAIDVVYGTVANTGIAIGPVAVCRDLASIDKVKQGDILVASMTRPEYMAAIKKAAAIVTDEGGITCHAAIVARELGIPCVIGTKVATKVFKDGDMVEVRANHGMIKKV